MVYRSSFFVEPHDLDISTPDVRCENFETLQVLCADDESETHTIRQSQQVALSDVSHFLVSASPLNSFEFPS